MNNSSKLNDISLMTTGVVANRKKAKNANEAVKSYKMLTIKSINNNGSLNYDELDDFYSKEILDDKYLTKVGDIVIRLSSPYSTISIGKKQTDLVISSLFIVMRLTTNKLLSEYLSIYLNSEKVKNDFVKSSVGSTIQIIKAGFLKEYDITYPTVEKQSKIVELNNLMIKEKNLLEQLLEEKYIYNNNIISKMIEEEKNER